MEDWWTFCQLLLATVCILGLLYGYFFEKDPKTPPGPRGLPFLGMLPWLGSRPYEKITKIGEKYGEVFQMRVGIRTVVVLNSEEVIKEALGNDWAFAGRPNFPSIQALLKSGGQSRFVMRTAGPDWRFLRKNAIKGLALFASSKNSRLNQIVMEAGETFHAELDKHLNEPFEPSLAVFRCVSSVIGRVNFGVDYDANDPLLKDVVQLTEVVAKFLQVGSGLDFLPLGQIFMGWKIRDFQKAIQPVNDLTEKHIRDHKFSTDKVRDLADALGKVANETPEEELKSLGLKKDQIRFISQDLFGAGFATTMETFLWSVNLLAAFPEKQRTLQQELDDVLGTRTPDIQDRDSLPYCESVLLEVLRVSSLVPFSLPHCLMADTELRGFRLPRGAVVLSNVFGHHRNPKVFQQPEKFQPERFLNGSELDTDLAQKILAFSTGKRRCAGENMARQELFLLIAQTFQAFWAEPAPGVTIDPSKAEPGFTRRPPRYELIFKRRNVP